MDVAVGGDGVEDKVVGGVWRTTVYPSSDADVESDTCSSTSSGSVVQCPKCGGAGRE